MQPIRINPIYQASAERLFDAWTKPDQMRLGLFKSPTNKIVRIDQTLIVGGRYSIVEKADGREIDHNGEYTAIDPPHRLAFWLEVPVHFAGRTDIVVSFLTTSEGCEMNFIQTGVDMRRWSKELAHDVSESRGCALAHISFRDEAAKAVLRSWTVASSLP